MNPEQEARRVAAQQSEVAKLGLAALSGLALDALMDMAVQTVATTLGVEYAKILKLLPDGEELLLVSGVGWQPGLVGSARVGTGADSQAGYTLRCDEPVVVRELATEPRFQGPALLTEHDVVSGMSVVIQGREWPFGVFGTHSRLRHNFSEHDANFLQAVANVVGTAIERQRTEDALRKSQQRLAVAVEAVRGGLYEHSVPLDSDMYHSARWAEILGYRLQELPSEEAFLDWLLPRVHPDDTARQQRAYRDFVAGRTRRYDVEVRLRHKEGHWLWVRSFAHALERDEQERVRRLAGLMFDIDEQKRAQAEREQLLQTLSVERMRLQALTESLEERVAQRTRQLQRRTEQLSAMALSLTAAEQRERERISQILHDDLQQLLYAAQMQATMVGDELAGGENERLLEQLGELERLYEQAITVTRSLTVELRPPLLEREGLKEALAWLSNHMGSAYGLRVAVRAEEAVEPASSELRELAFQMVRELLFNVVKHARAEQAQVTVRAEDARCLIEVADEGQGFDAGTVNSATPNHIGYGLRTMRQRLALFDGTLQVQSAPGQGTRVTFTVPAVRGAG